MSTTDYSRLCTCYKLFFKMYLKLINTFLIQIVKQPFKLWVRQEFMLFSITITLISIFFIVYKYLYFLLLFILLIKQK